MFDYLRHFPIDIELLPQRLRELLSPIGMQQGLRVEVCSSYEHDRGGLGYEALLMQMALVENIDDHAPTQLSSEAGVVAYSVPNVRERGSAMEFSPGIDGREYVIAAWGDGSFFSYNLAEKVWMALGLVPRCIGNDVQKLVYDDLSGPTTHVAEGEISSQYYWEQSRNIRWTMSNEYLRRYLWLRGFQGARVFFYETMLEDRAELRALMTDGNRFDFEEEGHWCSVSLFEIDGAIRLQVWATVVAVSCELIPEATAYGIQWPGMEAPVTRENVRLLNDRMFVFLDDRFLEKYEMDKLYDSVPIKIFGRHWTSSPSYHGKWSFTGCRRHGRNFIRVSVRDLYLGIPTRETLHAYSYALDPAIVGQFDDGEEHVIAKTERLSVELLDFADNLCALGAVVGLNWEPVELIKLPRADIEANGWKNAPALVGLARVAPRDMGEQQFLSRCKALHEIWQVIPKGNLRRLLTASGVPLKAIKEYGTLKLLQALLNVLQSLNQAHEEVGAFASEDEPENWNERNERLAALFVLNDLRISDAHTLTGDDIQKLELLGFDLAELRAGYGHALDYVFDGVINAFSIVNGELESLLNR